MGILSTIGKGLIKKTSKESSKDVAKRGGEVMGRRATKDMGMVEEVQPKRISGPAVETKDVAKRGGISKGAAAGIAGAGAATGVAIANRSKEETKAPSRVESKGRSFQEDRPTRDVGRVSPKPEETIKAKESDKKTSTFGSAFKEARAAGKDVFTYNGKKYTTEMAGEKKATPKAPLAIAAEDDATMRLSKGVREGRNENIDDDTRKRAMASVANLAKGGYVNCGASVPAAQKAKK